MSKAPQRKKTAKRRSAREEKRRVPIDEGTRRHLLVILAVVALAGIPFTLGKYFEFNSSGAFDSGSYVYSAKHILSGARVGYEEKPSAQAGTLLFNMLGVRLCGFRETGSELLQMLFQAAALALMFVTVRRLYGTLAAVVSVTVASIYLSAPLIAKYGNVKEQFMIAFMILGMCCFVFYGLKGKWWWAVLSGALLVWGPMFKQTGLSAIAATGVYVLAQPILHRTPWKRAGKDILLLVAGAAAVLAPIMVWYVSMAAPPKYWPYSFILGPVYSVFEADNVPPAEPQQAPAGESSVQGDEPKSSLILRFLPGYVRDSWEALGPAGRKEAYHRVLRYYRLLILPIVLALGAMLARAVVVLGARRGKPKKESPEDQGRFVVLFAAWWFFDMAFVWISPRSYEQYYLPLNASGAMLGGYLVGLYAEKLRHGPDRSRWMVLGLLGVVVMLAMSWHIFFGIGKSPHSGGAYTSALTNEPQRRRGYLQKWQEVSANARYPWEHAGRYIREHSEPADRIYVWGWVAGIYVEAQRLSSARKAFEGTMHTLAPAELAGRVRELLDAFEKQPPKFIVDTRKDHFPWNRPPLELWPVATFAGGKRVSFLPADASVIQSFDTMWRQSLDQNWGAAEAQRYEAMAPLRQYVMQNYQVVELQHYRAIRTRFGLATLVHDPDVGDAFGMHVVFVRK